MKRYISLVLAVLIALAVFPATLEAKTSKHRKQKHSNHHNKTKLHSKSHHVSSGNWKVRHQLLASDEIRINENDRISQNLHYKMGRSKDIALVQIACARAGTMPFYRIGKNGIKVSSIDGYYGRQTLEAVKRFQAMYNIKADGYYVNKYTRFGMNYALETGHPPKFEIGSPPSLVNTGAKTTWYHANEKKSDNYTNQRIGSIPSIPLAPPTAVYAGTAAVNPELIRFGSLLIFHTTDGGEYYYVASDTGWDVIDEVASHGKQPVIDLYGNYTRQGLLTIVEYQGQKPLQELPPKLAREMVRFTNWVSAGGENNYTFRAPKHMQQYRSMVAER